VTASSIPATALPAEPANRRDAEGRRLEGTYAGGVSRLLGLVIDWLIVTSSFAFGGTIFEYVVSTVLPVELDLSDTPIISGIALGVWAFTYFTYALTTTGRTVGKAIVGTRVVRADGSDLHFGRAAVRVLTLPLSFVLLGVGLLLIVLRADRRALHDLISDTAEVYSWQPR
jgi:uncharacterized RDD family membrane protein YckC